MAIAKLAISNDQLEIEKKYYANFDEFVKSCHSRENGNP
jgi:hypothetical protein